MPCNPNIRNVLKIAAEEDKLVSSCSHKYLSAEDPDDGYGKKLPDGPRSMPWQPSGEGGYRHPAIPKVHVPEIAVLGDSHSIVSLVLIGIE